MNDNVTTEQIKFSILKVLNDKDTLWREFFGLDKCTMTVREIHDQCVAKYTPYSQKWTYRFLLEMDFDGLIIYHAIKKKKHSIKRYRIENKGKKIIPLLEQDILNRAKDTQLFVGLFSEEA